VQITKAASAEYKQSRCKTVRHAREPLTPAQLAAKALLSQRQAKRRAKVDWDAYPLGRVPDEDIAELLNVCVSTVRSARNARGIARYKGGGE
jgi:hypothetical protein